MKLRKLSSLFSAAMCTFLMTVVRTEPLLPPSVAPHRNREHTRRDDAFLPRPDESTESSSRYGDIFRVRRSDLRNWNEEAEVVAGARYLINASPTSQPIMFFHDANSDSHEVRNSMLLIKKRRKKPSHATVFTHDSAMSKENPSISSSSEETTISHSDHKPLVLKTTSSSPPMYYHDFNSAIAEDKYYSAGNMNTQSENSGILGNVWRRTTKTPSMINNHHLGSYVKPKPTPSPPKTSDITRQDSESSAVIWKWPTTKIPSDAVISNHRPGSKGTLPWKKPPDSGGYSIKRPLLSIKKPAYFSLTVSTEQPYQGVRKPVYSSQALSSTGPHQTVKKPAYFSLTMSTTAPYYGANNPTYFSQTPSTTTPPQTEKDIAHFSQTLSTTTQHETERKPEYFSQTFPTTEPHQTEKKPTYFSQTLPTTTSHQTEKKPVYFSQTSSLTASHQGVKKPAYFSQTSLSTDSQQGVKKTVYFSQTSSLMSPHQGVKKPEYSTAKTEYAQETTAATHHQPHPPDSSRLTETTIFSSFTSTTQRPYFEKFTTDSVISKATTQRPSSIKSKGTPSHVLATSPQHIKKPVFQQEEPPKVDEDYKTQVNNHRPLTMIRRRKPLLPTKIHNPSSHVAIVDKPQQPATDVIGQRIKFPETVRSKWMTVLDAPSNRPTTVRHNKLIVAQKRIDKLPQGTLSPLPYDQVTASVVVTSQPIVALTTKDITTTKPITVAQQTTKVPQKETFPVAPVIDPWSDIPVPSAPSWAVSSTPRPPSLGSPSSSSFFPGMPYIPYFGSLFSPLMNRPLRPSTVNTGMQGIKAMQGFLRNSLMGAMFCFLPSALIAMTMTATQRAELRKIPEINNFMLFCKKCLENLETIEELEKTEPDWVRSL